MKRTIAIIGVGILLLFVFTAIVSGERIVSDNKTPATVGAEVNIAPAQPPTPTDQTPAAPDRPVTPVGSPIFDDFGMPDGESDNYQIPWESINAGGDDLQSAGYQMMFSVGQSVVGYATSDDYEAGIGYWYGVGACDCGEPGDVDGTGGAPTPLDVSYLVNKVFKSQDALYDYTATCPYENGDMDCTGGAATPLDVSYLVNKVFKSQDALCDRCTE